MNTTLMMSNWGRYLGKKLMKTRSKFKHVTDTTHWNIVAGDKVKVRHWVLCSFCCSVVWSSLSYFFIASNNHQVTQGREMGQEGIVTAVLRSANRIIIEGVNMVSSWATAERDKHYWIMSNCILTIFILQRRRIVKKKGDGVPGKIVTKACSVHYSNVMLVDPTTGWGI